MRNTSSGKLWLALGALALALALPAQQAYLDSIEALLPKLKDDSLRIVNLGELSWGYRSVDAAKAVDYGQQALQLAKDYGNSAMLGQANNDLGAAYYSMGEYEKAIVYLLEAARLAEADGQLLKKARSYIWLGIVHKENKNYEQALGYYAEAERIFKAHNDISGLSYVYLNMGGIYTDRDEYEQALGMYEKNLHIVESQGDEAGVANALNNIGNVYHYLKDYGKSVDYYRRSLDIRRRIGDQSGVATTLLNVAGDLYARQRFAEAQDYAQQGLDMARSINSALFELKGLELSAAIARGLGRFEEALDYQIAYGQLRDTIFNQEKMAQILELETKYKTEQAARELAFQKQRNRLQAWLAAGAIGLLVLAFGLVFLALRNRQRQRLREEQARYQERLARVSIETQEMERKRLARDLHDGIGQQLSGLKMAWQQLGAQLGAFLPEGPARIQQLSEVLQEAATEVRNLSHQMMPKALSEFGLVPAIQDMLDKSLGHSGIRYEWTAAKLGRLDEQTEIGLYRIVQELLNNIIKHAGASEVDLQLYRSKGELILIVEDNGRGFDPAQASQGHGLLNIASRAQAIGGQVRYDSRPGAGCVATLRLREATAQPAAA